MTETIQGIRAQTRDEQVALLRSFVSKPEPKVTA